MMKKVRKNVVLALVASTGGLVHFRMCEGAYDTAAHGVFAWQVDKCLLQKERQMNDCAGQLFRQRAAFPELFAAAFLCSDQR